MTFAGCVLEPLTFKRWQEHFSPPAQPFFVSGALSGRLPARWPRLTRAEFSRSVSLSLQDTFSAYNVSREADWVLWLTYGAFSSLTQPVQLELLQTQRTFGRAGVFHVDEMGGLLPTMLPFSVDGLFVWWPELWTRLSEGEKIRALKVFVEADRLPCRRGELTAEHWQEISTRLPGAHGLAGTFLPDSGGNCFGAVMAASGAPAVGEVWVQPGTFERWLGRFAAVSQPLESVLGPPIADILVWRGADGTAQHAAVGLGRGFVPAQRSAGLVRAASGDGSGRRARALARRRTAERLPTHFLNQTDASRRPAARRHTPLKH